MSCARNWRGGGGGSEGSGSGTGVGLVAYREWRCSSRAPMQRPFDGSELLRLWESAATHRSGVRPGGAQSGPAGVVQFMNVVIGALSQISGMLLECCSKISLLISTRLPAETSPSSQLLRENCVLENSIKSDIFFETSLYKA